MIPVKYYKLLGILCLFAIVVSTARYFNKKDVAPVKISQIDRLQGTADSYELDSANNMVDEIQCDNSDSDKCSWIFNMKWSIIGLIVVIAIVRFIIHSHTPN